MSDLAKLVNGWSRGLLRQYSGVIVVAVWLLEFSPCGSTRAGTFLEGALTYDPPPMLYAVEMLHDPGDDPFSGAGPGVTFLSYTDSYTNFGQLTFQFLLVGFSMGNGKQVQFEKVGTNELRHLFEDLWEGHITNATPVQYTNVAGLQGVSIRGIQRQLDSRRQQYVDCSWFQVETNLVLSIRAEAQQRALFDTIVGSLKTVSLDKQKFLASLRPKPPKTARDVISKVEAGEIVRSGRRVSVFVLHGEKKIWRLVLGFYDEDTRQELMGSLIGVLAKLREQSKHPGVRCRTTVIASRIGSGRDAMQISCAFHVVGDLPAIRGHITQKLEGSQPFGLEEAADRGAPDGFRKTQEFSFKLELYIEEDQ